MVRRSTGQIRVFQWRMPVAVPWELLVPPVATKLPRPTSPRAVPTRTNIRPIKLRPPPLSINPKGTIHRQRIRTIRRRPRQLLQRALPVRRTPPPIPSTTPIHLHRRRRPPTTAIPPILVNPAWDSGSRNNGNPARNCCGIVALSHTKNLQILLIALYFKTEIRLF